MADQDETGGQGTGMELWEAVEQTLAEYVPSAEELAQQLTLDSPDDE